MRKWVLRVGLAALLAVCVPAGAVTVSYTVDGWGPTSYPGPHAPPPGAPHLAYPGDSVGLVAYTGSLLDLPSGPIGTMKTYTQKINTLSWVVDWTYNGTDDNLANDGPPPLDWPELQFQISGARGMSIDGDSGSLTQGGLLRTNWEYDYLGLSAGPMVTFYIDNTYKIDVTPLGLPEKKINNWSGNPPWTQTSRDVMAKFDVTVIPEPLTMLGVFLGVSGLAGYIRRRKLARA